MWSFTPFGIPTYSNLHKSTPYNTTLVKNSAIIAMLRFVYRVCCDLDGFL